MAIITVNDHRLAYEAMGLEGEALENFVREGAAERHQSRVAAVRAAFKGQEGVLYALALADQFGVGGRADTEGHGTDRIPALAEFGKGRKQASDGGAWSAAIKEAWEGLQYERYNLSYGPSGRVVSYSTRLAGWSIRPAEEGDHDHAVVVVSPKGEVTPITWEDLPPRWARAMAAHLLREVVRPTRKRHSAEGPAVASGDVPGWSRVFNLAAARMEADAQALREKERLRREEEAAYAAASNALWERELLAAE